MTQYSLKVIQNTVLKNEPIESSRITDPNLKVAIAVGRELEIHSYRYDAARDHFIVAFLKEAFNGKNTWWVYAKHVQLFKDGKSVISVKLDVPWFSQLDNEHYPHGTCNVTSIAMCLTYLGLRPQANQQMEDEFCNYCDNNGLDRRVPADMARLISVYGYKDKFQNRATWDAVKQWLEGGNPAIVHGWFTRSGHIMTIIGYNDKGWIVNDPNGKWLENLDYDNNYDTNATGEGRTYSYEAMSVACGPDAGGELWIHFVSK